LPEKVLLWCLGKPDVEWLVTPDVMAEYVAVIQRPNTLPKTTASWWLELLAADTCFIRPTATIEFTRDRKAIQISHRLR